MSGSDTRATVAELGVLWVDWRNADDLRRRGVRSQTHEIARRFAHLGGWPLLCRLFEDFERTHGMEAAAWLDARWNGFEHDGMGWAS